MISRNFVLSAGVIALLAAARTAAATPVIPDPETPPVTVLFGTTYYTNVADSSALFAAARGLKRVDVSYDPAVNLNFVEPMGGISFFLAGQAGYDFYQRNSVLNRERIDLQGGADAQLNVCHTTLVGAYARHQSDLVDLDVQTTKNTQELYSGELDATCNESGLIVPSASIAQTWSDNSAIGYVAQDYRSIAANGSLKYDAGSIGLISLVGGYTQTEYPHRFLLVGNAPVSDGYDLYFGGIHYEREIGESLQLAGTVSETTISPDAGLGKGFSGITYDGSLVYTPTARLTLNLAISRQTTPSSYLNAAYSVNQKYSGEVDYRLSSRLKAALGALQTHSDFGGAALVQGTDITVQTIQSFYGSLAFNASPTFSVTLKAGQDQRHANVLGYSYSGAHVGLAVSKSF